MSLRDYAFLNGTALLDSPLTYTAGGTPTLDSAVADKEVRISINVALNFSSYFSNVDHYEIMSGLPVGTGYTISGSSLVGTANAVDITDLNDTNVVVRGWNLGETLYAEDTFTLTVLLGYDTDPIHANGFLADDTDISTGSTFDITTEPSHGTYTPVAGAGDIDVQYVPALAYNGADSFVYRVKDRTSGAIQSGTVNLFIGKPVEDTPIGTQNTVENIAITPVDLSSNSSGADTYGLSGLPAGSGLTFASSTLSGTPNATDLANTPMSLTPSYTNGEGTTTGTIFTLNVGLLNYTLVVHELFNENVVDTVNVIDRKLLVINEISNDNFIETINIWPSTAIVINEMSNDNVIDTIDISIHHPVIMDSISNDNVIDTVNVTYFDGSIEITDVANDNVIETVVLTQYYQAIIRDVRSGNKIDNVELVKYYDGSIDIIGPFPDVEVEHIRLTSTTPVARVYN